MVTAARDFVILVGGSLFALFVGVQLIMGGFDPSYWTSTIVVASIIPMQRIHVAGAIFCCLFLFCICCSVFIRHKR